jgi:hypothetical protein
MTELLFYIFIASLLGWAFAHHDDDIKGGE